MNKRVWTGVVGSVLAGLVLTGCGGGGDEASAADGKTIKVASSLSLAPYEFVDTNGKATGYEVEVVEKVLGNLGYDVEWVKTPFEQLFTGLQAKRYEMGASGVYERCERVENTKEYGAFTLPMGRAGLAMTVRSSDGPEISSWDDLDGLKLGVESAGSTSDKVADANADAGFSKQIYPDTNALMLALQQGRIDVALQSEDVTRYVIKDNDALKTVWTVDDTQQPFGWIVRDGDPLLDKLNDGIDEARENGELETIYEKWFGEAPPADHPASASAEVVPITASNCKE